MKTILYIHGAFATPLSFTLIQRSLPEHKAEYLEYDVADDLYDVIDNEVKRLVERGERVEIISHSLGGVLASRIAQKSKMVDKVVTMGTPFGGNKAAALMKWLNPHPMFKIITPNSYMLSELRSNAVGAPTLSLVTTAGRNPMFNEPNDGVVTIDSQQSFHGPDYVEVPYSHIEVLLAEQTIKMITEFLF